MQIQENEDLLERLKNNYFSDPNRFLWLPKGDILIEEGSVNSRLFFIRSGRLTGFVENDEQEREIVFSASENSFLGVYSFFSRTYYSLVTIQADTDCELAYIDKLTKPVEGSGSIEKDFMPFAVKDLVKRQNRMLEISKEKQDAQKKLLENQNLTALGQIAAGIAHELNNAIAVLGHNTKWLSEQMAAFPMAAEDAALILSGLNHGRALSSREVRTQTKSLQTQYPGLESSTARLLAQMDPDSDLLKKLSMKTSAEIQRMFSHWEMGVALHDMQVAARQSAHVVKSVKELGNVHKTRQAGVDLNKTVENALTLLHHKTRDITVHLDLNPLPAINANVGEWIQVWTNLIKNSSEAMLDAATSNPKLTISSQIVLEQIQIKVTDNGPGIPDAVFSTIFQPNVTTKVRGLSFGLGLGLTIVKRIITEYDGRIDVRSSVNGTTFTIYIPIGGSNV